MNQEERTQFYFNETFDTPKEGDNWAFYDGVWHFDGDLWYYPN